MDWTGGNLPFFPLQRGIAAPEIARVIGISDRAVRAAFTKALHRQTEDALDAWHRIETGGLAMEATISVA